MDGTYIFAGTGSSSGVFISSDDGANWQFNSYTNKPSSTRAFAINHKNASETDYFVGCDVGVYLTSDFGKSWTQVNNGLTDTVVGSLAIIPNAIDTVIFAGTQSKGVFRSSDNGTTWTAANNGLTNPNITTLQVDGTNIFAGTTNSIFRSTDKGITWTALNSGLQINAVISFAVYGADLFAGTYNNGIFLSTDNGTSWSSVDSGFSNLPVQSLSVSGSYLFAGIIGGGVWMRPLTEMITGVNDTKNNLPLNISLYQNYPNPFNPTTTINYEIPKSGLVTIKVFDELGREVATLVNEEKPVGRYSVNFNGSNLTSGVYYYRLQAGNFTQTKKLILLK